MCLLQTLPSILTRRSLCNNVMTSRTPGRASEQSVRCGHGQVHKHAHTHTGTHRASEDALQPKHQMASHRYPLVAVDECDGNNTRRIQIPHNAEISYELHTQRELKRTWRLQVHSYRCRKYTSKTALKRRQTLQNSIGKMKNIHRTCVALNSNS